MGSGAAPNVRGTSSAAYVASTASSSAPSPGPIDGWSFTCVGRREERREPRVRLGARTKDAGGLERAGGARGGRGGLAGGVIGQYLLFELFHIGPLPMKMKLLSQFVEGASRYRSV